jgi:hypothetical protein
MEWEELVDANEKLRTARALRQKPEKKKARNNPEAQVQKEIMDYLSSRSDIYAFRVNAGRVKTDRGHWYEGAPAGVSDIIGIHIPTGRFLAIEVKAGSNQPTKLQTDFMSMVEASGGIAFVAWSVEQVAARLEAA